MSVACGQRWSRRADFDGLHDPGGERKEFAKATRLAVPKGATLELMCGGGGGYGPPAERDVGAVLADVREGYISEAHARKHYPHAFVGPGAAACLDTR